jgi:hypothetical protein
MPIHDDDLQFEQELRRFTPREVAPLPARRSVPRWWPAVIAAGLLLVFGSGLLWRQHRGDEHVPFSKKTTFSTLTLGQSQAALLKGPSLDAAIDELERESRLKDKKPVQGSQTAFKVLGRDEL